jgi:hypothetical protein
MKGIIATAVSTTVLDHHHTAKEALFGIDEELAQIGIGPAKRIVFDMERSGAGITWDELAADRDGTCEECGTRPAETHIHVPGCVFAQRPTLVNYVEDRDLWRMALPNAREYMANVYAAPMTFDAWDKLHVTPTETMLTRGEGILAYMQEYGTKALAEARLLEWPRMGQHITTFLDGREFWCVNLPYMNCSDYLTRLLEEKGAMAVAGYFRRADGRWQFSLRSVPGISRCGALRRGRSQTGCWLRCGGSPRGVRVSRPVKDCSCGDLIRCERCTNCSGGVQTSDQGFAFTCGTCRGSGWVHGSAADVVAGIRSEMRESR